MRCPQCQHENRETAKFCEECGTRLVRVCSGCGQEVSSRARFCPECGKGLIEVPPAAPHVSPQPYKSYTPRHLAEKILTSRSVLEGERRQVTVLFADLAGFTALAERLDPEVVHEVIDRCFERVTAEIHRFEGTVNQSTGDGVMVLFGAPIAHEDGPRRAVHAALGIQRSIRDFSRELQARRGFGLQMRIGLNTGMVVVGKIGDDLRMDYTAVGDTTNLAARLQQWARPGSVVISAATHRLVSGFFEMLELARQAGDRRREVEVLLGLCDMYNWSHRAESAVEYIERALAIARELDDRALQAACLSNRFMVRSFDGQVVKTMSDAEEALCLSKEVKDPKLLAQTLIILGMVLQWRADYEQALTHLHEGAELAEEFFRRAWALLDEDIWFRWRWYIPLLRARGELALAEGQHEEAWSYAIQSLEMATQTDSRKHVARAQWPQGEILAADGRLDDAAQRLAESVRLAERIHTPREIWMGKASLGKVLARMGRDKEAEAQLLQASQTIEAIAENLRTLSLLQSFLGAEPVLEVCRALGRRPPQPSL